MDQANFIRIIERYEKGEASEAEQALLESWYFHYGNETADTGQKMDYDAIQRSIWQQLSGQPQFKPKKTTFLLWHKLVASAAVIFLVAGVYFFYTSQHQRNVSSSGYANDIAPGKVGATLTLASGKKIRLGDVANGKIASEAGITVSKTIDGQVVYEMKADEHITSGHAAMNTLTTAKGETYIVTLPDQSRVWLNAASSLTYPASLNERGLRRVRLEGEAYFEVAKDKKRPFVVESRNQVVTVLGTHFNINSYRNERAVKTALLEGSVKVNPVTGYGNIMKDIERVLKPGQQSSLDGKHVIEVEEANLDEVLAWKDGFFRFNGENVQSIMRKLSRWYDIEVVYEGDMSTEVYYGKVSRSKNISAVLKVLEKSQGVHFKIEGRRVTVLE